MISSILCCCNFFQKEKVKKDDDEETYHLKDLISNCKKWIDNNVTIDCRSHLLVAFFFQKYIYYNDFNLDLKKLTDMVKYLNNQTKNEKINEVFNNDNDLIAFIDKIKALFPEGKFQSLFEKFDLEILRMTQVVSNTMKLIKENFEYEKDKEFFIQTKQHIEKLVNRELKYEDDFGVLTQDNQNIFITMYKPKERRFSVIVSKEIDTQIIGVGSTSEVSSMLSLTMGCNVAVKIFKSDWIKEAFNRNLALKEIKNLEKFLDFKKIYGLPFLPVQKFLHKFRDSFGNPGIVSIKYQCDLLQWLDQIKSPFDTINVIYQILAFGNFTIDCEYYNLDYKAENILINKGSKGPVIAFADLTGDFQDTLPKFIEDLFTSYLIPEDEFSLLNNYTQQKYEIYLKKISDFQLGCIAFACIAGNYPHDIDRKRRSVIFRKSPFGISSKVEMSLKTNLQKFKLKVETEQMLESIILNLITPNIEKRATCKEAFKSLIKLIQNDTDLLEYFKELGYHVHWI